MLYGLLHTYMIGVLLMGMLVMTAEVWAEKRGDKVLPAHWALIFILLWFITLPAILKALADEDPS